MKISEAKQKICPFMSLQYGNIEQLCITNDCMAWEYTKTCEVERLGKDFKNETGEWQNCNSDNPLEFGNSWIKPILNENDKEGKCKRLDR